MNSLGAALKRLRESRGLSQTQLANLLGEHRTTIAYRESGRTGLTAEGFEQLAQKLGVTVRIGPDGWEIAERPPPRDPLDHATEVSPAPFRLPLLGLVGAGPATLVETSEARYVDIWADWGQRVDCILVVSGSSMQPLLWPGDFVGVRLLDDLHGLPKGTLVVAEDGDRDVMVKIYWGWIGGRLALQSYNPAHPPMVGDVGDLTVRGVVDGWWHPTGMQVK